jgi:RHS repeat-associated protein
VVERDSYDAWGRRRNANGTDASAACTAITSATTRGFTGQEMMDSQCAINFNARLYDPTIGRMMSADPTIPDPLKGQSFNRYSYVNNGPLSATDPSGYEDVRPRTYYDSLSFRCLSCWGPGLWGMTQDRRMVTAEEAGKAAVLAANIREYYGGIGAANDANGTGVSSIGDAGSSGGANENGLDTIVVTHSRSTGTEDVQFSAASDTNGVNFGGLGRSLSYSGSAVDFIHLYSAGAIALAMHGESAVSGIKVVGRVFGAMGGALVVGEQGAGAAAEIQQGASPTIAVTGALVNSAAIIGSATLSELAVDAAVGAAFGGPVGAVVGVGAGIVVGYGLESYLTPTATGQFVGQQLNNLNAQSPWGGGP